MNLRLATEQDLPRLLCWSRDFEDGGRAAAAGEPFIGATMAHLGAHPERGGVYVLLDDERGPVGYAVLLRFWSNAARGETLVIDELYVEPARRGGAGRAALQAIEELSRALEIYVLALEVDPAQPQAAGLYAQVGYTQGHLVYHKVLDPDQE